MFGGRKRCNVADDGSIVAWYGDADYKEDGSMGQVMVYQPKFYYLVCPVEYDPIDTGIGYHLRKANYYVSEKPRAGFRLHPAFYDASGNEIDYFLTSAYEGSIYDASASAYLLNDEQVMNTGEDKFSSIAGARPASGSSQNLTRQNIEAMAQNRGTNWHGDLIKQVSAEQMLMIIEMGMMNLQTAIAQGVVSLPWTTGVTQQVLMQLQQVQLLHLEMVQVGQRKQPHMKVVLLKNTLLTVRLPYVGEVKKTFGVTFGNLSMVSIFGAMEKWAVVSLIFVLISILQNQRTVETMKVQDSQLHQKKDIYQQWDIQQLVTGCLLRQNALVTVHYLLVTTHISLST